MSSRCLFAVVLVAGGLAPGRAVADPRDLDLTQLGNPTPCQTGVACPALFNVEAQANFRSFVRQLAAGVASVNLAPADTPGHAGFALNLELSVVNFLSGSLPTAAPLDGPLLIPSVHFRKGLPLSLEIGARVGWIERSRIGVGTLELRWALNEGFAFLPDIAVRGSITRLVNARGLSLTTGGLDLQVGKVFPLAGMITLTPYVGWNLLFVGASSERIDFDPGRTLALSDALGQQLTDMAPFAPVEAADNASNRFYGGFRFQGGVITLGGEVSYAVLGSFREKGSDGSDVNRDVPGVLAFNATVGVDF